MSLPQPATYLHYTYKETCSNGLERYLCAGAWAHLHFYEWRNFPFYLKGGSDRIKWNIIQGESLLLRLHIIPIICQVSTLNLLSQVRCVEEDAVTSDLGL